jgi:NitT/TauT family transport system substrate-binding protein
MNIRNLIAVTSVALISLVFLPLTAQALDKVSFGTNWLAQAEHGGFYQAVADGTYEKYGLDVTIVQGGPQAANRSLLVAGKIDFYMAGTLSAFDAVKREIPIVNVAAIFQKDPQVFLAHPDQGIEKFDDLAKLDTIFLGKDGFTTFFEWMKARGTGFRDEQYKPYQFTSAPFIADVNSSQQGYLTSEPYAIEQATGWAPKVFLLADEGFSPYATTIMTQRSTITGKPDVVQRFVDASIIGWYNYLYGDNAAANALIKADNPEMSDGQLAYSLEKMKEYGIVDSGDALELGIGCITDARFKEIFEQMAAVGIVEADLDYQQSYNTGFVCKKVGMELRP